MFGISVEWTLAYVAWLVVGFVLLARLARSRTDNAGLTMVLGTLSLLVPPVGALVLLYLAFKPRMGVADTQPSGM